MAWAIGSHCEERAMMTKTVPDSVKKRDGSVVPFDASKIEHALRRAALDVLHREDRAAEIARRVTTLVQDDLARSYRGKIPGMEDIQDAVEAALMKRGLQRDRQELHSLPREPVPGAFRQVGPGAEGRSQAADQRRGGAQEPVSAQGRRPPDRRDAQRAVPPGGPPRGPGRGQLSLGSRARRGGRRLLPHDARTASSCPTRPP